MAQPQASSTFGSESAGWLIMGKKSCSPQRTCHCFEALLKLQLWNLACGLYPIQLALRGQSRAHGTWFMSSTVVRRGGEGSVLVSCSPLLCFLKEPRAQGSGCLACCPADLEPLATWFWALVLGGETLGPLHAGDSVGGALPEAITRLGEGRG